MTPESNLDDQTPQPAYLENPYGSQSKWRENHGNLLILFVSIVFVLGACVLFYRQNRFVPVRFPDSDMIDTPMEEEQVVAEDPSAGTVDIKITGSANDFGSMKIAIYDRESSFNHVPEAVVAMTTVIVDGEAVWSVPLNSLPKKFAVAAYHDENEDDQLNRNRLGIPSERYGFSRNARGYTGPPNYKQAVINRPSAGEAIELFIR